MSGLGLYWWSPRKAPSIAASEIRHHGAAWARLGLLSGGVPFTNYGDELNHGLVSKATDRSISWRSLKSAQLVAIGSILVPYLRRGSTAQVWGSGLNTPDGLPTLDETAKSRFLAVRGPMTRDALGLHAATPLGDPGLIASELYSFGRLVPRGLLVVPHFTVFQTRHGVRQLEALRAAGYEVVLPTASPEEVMRRICAAEAVFSSGLHGVILAHSFGKPASLFRFADSKSPLAFKYHDYHSSIGIDEPRALLWRDLLDTDQRDRAIAHGLRELDETRHEIAQRQEDIRSSARKIL